MSPDESGSAPAHPISLLVAGTVIGIALAALYFRINVNDPVVPDPRRDEVQTLEAKHNNAVATIEAAQTREGAALTAQQSPEDPPLPDCTSREPAHQLGFVDGELILTGTQTQIELALATLTSDRLIRERRALVAFGDILFSDEAIPSFLDNSGLSSLGYTPADYPGLVISLVTLDCGISSVDAYGRINELIQDRSLGVVVEFNRLTARSSVTNPYVEMVGDPTDSIAPIGPHAANACCSVSDAQEAVDDQATALNSRFKTATPGFSYAEATVAATGSVKVAIFDNYPIPTGLPNSTPAPFTTTIEWASPTLELPIHPYDSTNYIGSTWNRSDHGIFTAGLIHSLNSSASISIHQVLDPEAEGKLSTLLKAVGKFITSESGVTLASGTTPTPDPAAMADTILHLGLHLKPGRADVESPRQEPYSLKVLLLLADDMDATTVVATGNFTNKDGTGTKPAFQPATLPDEPGFDYLIAVGAGKESTVTAGLLDTTKDACFAAGLPEVSAGTPSSNSIREFGGFARCDTCTHPPDDVCDSLDIHKKCAQAVYAAFDAAPSSDPELTCSDALISLSLTNPPTPDGSGGWNTGGTGYGYWIGTSFSSALVTGWIADQKD